MMLIRQLTIHFLHDIRTSPVLRRALLGSIAIVICLSRQLSREEAAHAGDAARLFHWLTGRLAASRTPHGTRMKA